jgi:hypothetical protein
MKEIVVDPETIASLLALTERVELVDADGKSLGYYDPPDKEFSTREVARMELDRIEGKAKGMSTDEAMVWLLKRRRDRSVPF